MQGPIIFNGLVGLFLLIYIFVDVRKAWEVIKSAFRSFRTVMPLLVVIFALLILMQQTFTEHQVAFIIKQTSGAWGYLVAGFLGAIVHIPLFVAFPVGGNLLHTGVNPGFIAVLITSLVMVHTFSIPVEVRELGLRFALKRNILSLIFALCIGIIMGVLY